MKRRLAAPIAALSAATVIALGFCSQGSANAAENPTVKMKTIQTAGQVCASTLTFTPHGHWTCAVKDSVKVRLLGHKALRAETGVPAASDENCDHFGNCWIRGSNLGALFNGGIIAYGDQDDEGFGEPIDEVLGYTILNGSWTLSGTKESQKGSFKLQQSLDSDGLEDVQWDGALFNGAPGTEGTQIGSKCPEKQTATLVTQGQHTDSPAGWCTESDNQNHDHYMKLIVSWEDPAFDGFWEAFTTSICSHSDPVPATSYTLYPNPTQVPTPAWGGGWFE